MPYSVGVQPADGASREEWIRSAGYDPNNPPPFLADSSASKKQINYSDYNGDWFKYLNDMAASGDADSLDRLLNYMMSEQSSMTAREWTAGREDTQYQRLVKDLKAAGINPYALLNSGGSPVSSASSGNSYTGSYASNASLKKETNDAKWASIITGLLSTIIMAVAIAV